MVVISDQVDNVKDIHPPIQKACWRDWLANYHWPRRMENLGIVYKNPLYQSMKVEKGKIRIQFQNAPNGLISRGGVPTEFLIAGEDQKFYSATQRLMEPPLLFQLKK